MVFHLNQVKAWFWSIANFISSLLFNVNVMSHWRWCDLCRGMIFVVVERLMIAGENTILPSAIIHQDTLKCCVDLVCFARSAYLNGSLAEVMNAIQRLKNGKADGPDGIGSNSQMAQSMKDYLSFPHNVVHRENTSRVCHSLLVQRKECTLPLQ
jgi:hypothetical protein